MVRVKLLFACLCLTACAAAPAGVVYTWRSAAATPDMRSVAGLIELSDAAAASPHVSYQAPSCDPWPCDLADPASPIQRFAFMVNGDAPSALAINLAAGTGYGLPMPAFDAEFDVGAGRLSGLHLFVNTLISTLRVNGNLVGLFSSDADNCYWGCSGAEGQFVAAELPEPGSAALFALACLAAGLAATGARGRTTHRHTPN